MFGLPQCVIVSPQAIVSKSQSQAEKGW